MTPGAGRPPHAGTPTASATALDRGRGPFALGGREVIPSPIRRSSRRRRATIRLPHRIGLARTRLGVVDHRPVVRRHRRRPSAPASARSWLRRPAGPATPSLPPRLDHLVGQPLELLLRARVGGNATSPSTTWATPSRRSLRHTVIRGVDGSRGSRYASNTHANRSATPTP